MTIDKEQSLSALQKAIKSAGDWIVGVQPDWRPTEVSNMKMVSILSAGAIAALDMFALAADDVLAYISDSGSHAGGILLGGVVVGSIAAVSAPRLAMWNKRRFLSRQQQAPTPKN